MRVALNIKVMVRQTCSGLSLLGNVEARFDGVYHFYSFKETADEYFGGLWE